MTLKFKNYIYLWGKVFSGSSSLPFHCLLAFDHCIYNEEIFAHYSNPRRFKNQRLDLTVGLTAVKTFLLPYRSIDITPFFSFLFSQSKFPLFYQVREGGL